MPPVPVVESDIEGAVPHCIIEITDEEADYLYKKLTVPYNIAIDVPKK